MQFAGAYIMQGGLILCALTLLLLNPKLVRVLREESSQDLDRRLRELDRAEREIRERLVENLVQVQIIETVRSAKRIPCIERLIEKL